MKHYINDEMIGCRLINFILSLNADLSKNMHKLFFLSVRQS